MYGFCNMYVCVRVWVYVWVLNNCVGDLVICVLAFTVFLYCFVYVCLLSVTGVRTMPPSENSVAVNNNNNNNNNK